MCHHRADLQLYERSDVIAASQLVDRVRKGMWRHRIVFRDGCLRLCSPMMCVVFELEKECNYAVERGEVHTFERVSFCNQE